MQLRYIGKAIYAVMLCRKMPMELTWSHNLQMLQAYTHSSMDVAGFKT
jgi:hypothetical protein